MFIFLTTHKKTAFITRTGEHRRQQNNETCLKGHVGHLCFKHWAHSSVWRTQKALRSHTHSKRGLSGPVYLMSKATVLVALKCSRGFFKRCTFCHEVTGGALSTSQLWGIKQKAEDADLVHQRPLLYSPTVPLQFSSGALTPVCPLLSFAFLIRGGDFFLPFFICASVGIIQWLKKDKASSISWSCS